MTSAACQPLHGRDSHAQSHQSALADGAVVACVNHAGTRKASRCLLKLIVQFGDGVLGRWVAHCNRGRPHSSLGPGIPDAPDLAPVLSGHRIRDGHRVVATLILGGLHHD